MSALMKHGLLLIFSSLTRPMVDVHMHRGDLQDFKAAFGLMWPVDPNRE